MADIMGVLNCTPDSFYEGSRVIDFSLNRAIERAHQMGQDGACIIDIGGESTRPGAEPVSLSQECDRVLPLIEALAKFPITISIDTRHPEVMRQAIKAGARLVNDVNALSADGVPLELMKQQSVSVCLMHMQGNPDTMQMNPHYQDVVQEVKDFLQSRMDYCVKSGLHPSKIMIDPGFGFGKTPEHNAQLLKNLDVFKSLGCKIVVGLSRKSVIEKWSGCLLPTVERLPGSLAAAVIAVLNGADIIRTHDVKETSQALKIAELFK